MRVVDEHRHGVARLGLSQVVGLEGQAVIDEKPRYRAAGACKFDGKARLPEATGRLDDHRPPLVGKQTLDLVKLFAPPGEWRRQQPSLLEQLLELAQIEEEARLWRKKIQILSEQVEVVASVELRHQPALLMDREVDPVLLLDLRLQRGLRWRWRRPVGHGDHCFGPETMVVDTLEIGADLPFPAPGERDGHRQGLAARGAVQPGNGVTVAIAGAAERARIDARARQQNHDQALEADVVGQSVEPSPRCVIRHVTTICAGWVMYRWQGQIYERTEGRVALRTRRSLLPQILEHTKRDHPYEVPSVVAHR